jgi:hypothetical protein
MMLDIVEIVRKTEAFLLPLLPRRWRHPPPSSRWILPLLKRLKHYRKWPEGLTAFLAAVRKRYYPAYHKQGWGDQVASNEIGFIRFILIVVVFSLLIALSGRTHLISPWMKGGLLLGSSILFIHGAMGVSISALWTIWGLLFPIYVSLAIGIAPWSIAFLALWALVWHAPLVRPRHSWQWVDFICTIPVLFLWVGSVGKMLPTWSLWQTTLLFLMLWLAVWAFLIQVKGHPRISRTLQLFFPGSLAMITLIAFAKPPLFGIYRWSLWVLGTFGLSLVTARLAPVKKTRWFLFQLKGVTLIFFTYGFLLLLSASFHPISERIDIVLSQLFESLEFLWWLLGAGIVLSIRGLLVLLIKWAQSQLNRWILPLSLWGLSLLTYAIGRMPSSLQEIGGLKVSGFWAASALGATFLTWRKKETLLREWVFWGLFIFFLLYQYNKSVDSTVEQYWVQGAMGPLGFLTISIWLLWLNFSSVGKILKKFGGKINERYVIMILGGLLWLMVALLWLSCVDQQFSIRGRINFHLLKGLTFFGFPLILYHLVGREYLKLTPSQDVRWGWILLMGIGFVQILQGVEHAVVAWLGNVPFDVFQKELHQAFLSGVPLDQAAPAGVRNPSWVSFWRILRWGCVMGFLPWVVRKPDQGPSSKAVLLFNACFLSVAVWTAEATWIFWPFMPLEWAVILRPWTPQLMWDSRALELLGFYCVASLLWGWSLSLLRNKRGRGRPSPPCLKEII